MYNLEVDTKITLDDYEVVASVRFEYGATVRYQMLADRLAFRMVLGECSQKVDGCRTYGPDSVGGLYQDRVVNPKFHTSMGAKILWIVGGSFDPVEIMRAKDDHGYRTPRRARAFMKSNMLCSCM